MAAFARVKRDLLLGQKRPTICGLLSACRLGFRGIAAFARVGGACLALK